MNYESAINIAVGCVMASHLENKEKREVIEKLRDLEDKLISKPQRNCIACNGSGWYDSCDKEGNTIPCGACDGTGKED